MIQAAGNHSVTRKQLRVLTTSLLLFAAHAVGANAAYASLKCEPVRGPKPTQVAYHAWLPAVRRDFRCVVEIGRADFPYTCTMTDEAHFLNPQSFDGSIPGNPSQRCTMSQKDLQRLEIVLNIIESAIRSHGVSYQGGGTPLTDSEIEDILVSQNGESVWMSLSRDQQRQEIDKCRAAIEKEMSDQLSAGKALDNEVRRLIAQIVAFDCSARRGPAGPKRVCPPGQVLKQRRCVCPDGTEWSPSAGSPGRCLACNQLRPPERWDAARRKCEPCPSGQVPSRAGTACECPNGQILDPVLRQCRCPRGQLPLGLTCVDCSRLQMVWSDLDGSCISPQAACLETKKIWDYADKRCCDASEIAGNGRCLACPEGQLVEAGQCVCPAGQGLDDLTGNCAPCTPGQVVTDNHCQCPVGEALNVNGTCTEGCRDGRPLSTDGSCGSACRNGFENLQTGACGDSCPTGTKPNRFNECVCAGDEVFIDNPPAHCAAACPAGLVASQTNLGQRICVRCPRGQGIVGNACSPCAPDQGVDGFGRCVTCGPGQMLGRDGHCQCPGAQKTSIDGTTCVSSCPGQSQLSLDGSACVETCGPGEEYSRWSTCTCPVNLVVALGATGCVAACPADQRIGLLQHCVCGGDEVLSLDGHACLAACPAGQTTDFSGQECVCPAGKVAGPDWDSCQDCPAGMVYQAGQCEAPAKACSDIQGGAPTVPPDACSTYCAAQGKYWVDGTHHCVPCPSGQVPDTDGRCIATDAYCREHFVCPAAGNVTKENGQCCEIIDNEAGQAYKHCYTPACQLPSE